MISFETNDNVSLSGLDLTPLIDIIFIVLVFLLLTANTQLLSLPVDVPTETDSSLSTLSQEKHIAINIMSDKPHWAINGHRYQTFSQFESDFIATLKTSPKAKIVVAADKNAPVQPLMNVLALFTAPANYQYPDPNGTVMTLNKQYRLAHGIPFYYFGAL